MSHIVLSDAGIPPVHLCSAHTSMHFIIIRYCRRVREKEQGGQSERGRIHRQIIDKIVALHGFLVHLKFHAFCIFPNTHVRCDVGDVERLAARNRWAYAANQRTEARLSQCTEQYDPSDGKNDGFDGGANDNTTHVPNNNMPSPYKLLINTVGKNPSPINIYSISSIRCCCHTAFTLVSRGWVSLHHSPQNLVRWTSCEEKKNLIRK